MAGKGRFGGEINVKSTKSSSMRGRRDDISGDMSISNRFSRYAEQDSRRSEPRNSVKKQSVLVNKPSKEKTSTSVVTKKGSVVMAPKGYTVRPIVPAKKAELLPVARAMNREEFAPRLKKLFDPEREAALEAIKTGIYIGWRCPDFKHDCIRVGPHSKCFCGHPLSNHHSYHSNSVRVPCNDCVCKAFAFVPSRAEEVGEWWLPRRRTFDASAWRAKCKCKHTHEEHTPNGGHRCTRCTCGRFESSFLCCACDHHWEDHVTVFESGEVRRQQGIPYGQHYLPFHELPELRNVVLTGQEDNNTFYEELSQGPFAIPDSKPSKLALQLQKNSENQPW